MGEEHARAARVGVAIPLKEELMITLRLMWVKLKAGEKKWVFGSAIGPGSEEAEEIRNRIWEGLADCLKG